MKFNRALPSVRHWIITIVASYKSYFFPLRHRWLLRLFVSRQIKLKYRDSWLGFTWSLLTPLFQLIVYTFVFQYLLGLRWANNNDSGFSFALLMLTGLAIFSFFAECVSQSPTLIIDQSNLVKKVCFPTEILAWALLTSTAFSTLILIGLLLVACLLLKVATISLAWCTLPLIWMPLIPLLLGLIWGCSALGVYFRDLRHIVALFVPLLQFLSPIFYPVSVLPEKFQKFMQMNPLTLIIEQSRLTIFSGKFLNWNMWGQEMMVCTIIAILGAVVHNRLRRGFADAI